MPILVQITLQECCNFKCSGYTSAFLNNVEQDGATAYEVGGTATNLHTGYLTIGIRIEGGNSTDAKAIQVSAGFWEGSARTGQRTTVSTGLYLGASAITSFSLLSHQETLTRHSIYLRKQQLMKIIERTHNIETGEIVDIERDETAARKKRD
jgi:hypothetical protein